MLLDRVWVEKSEKRLENVNTHNTLHGLNDFRLTVSRDTKKALGLLEVHHITRFYGLSLINKQEGLGVGTGEKEYTPCIYPLQKNYHGFTLVNV